MRIIIQINLETLIFETYLEMYCDKLKESKIRPVLRVLNVKEFDKTLN